jgi:hypothetical protein
VFTAKIAAAKTFRQVVSARRRLKRGASAIGQFTVAPQDLNK